MSSFWKIPWGVFWLGRESVQNYQNIFYIGALGADNEDEQVVSAACSVIRLNDIGRQMCTAESQAALQTVCRPIGPRPLRNQFRPSCGSYSFKAVASWRVFKRAKSLRETQRGPNGALWAALGDSKNSFL